MSEAPMSFDDVKSNSVDFDFACSLWYPSGSGWMSVMDLVKEIVNNLQVFIYRQTNGAGYSLSDNFV